MRLKSISLILVSVLILGSMMIGFANAPIVYPPYPLIKLTQVSPTVYEVWLMGEGEMDLDPMWDIQALEIYMHYNTNALAFVDGAADPDGAWAYFWPGLLMTDVHDEGGVVRLKIVGGPSMIDGHIEPYGMIRLFYVTFSVIGSSPQPWLAYLMNPEPRQELPPWGKEYFKLDVVGYPHVERADSPWMGAPWNPPIPHLVANPPLPVPVIDASTLTPDVNEIVTFDASGSYDPDGTIVGYAWDFGDGTTSTDVTTTHYYAQEGLYVVTLTVWDDSNLYMVTASTTMGVNVLQRASVEHRMYSVSKDEDAFNTLYAHFRNYGTASADVKAVFTTFDRKTGIQIGKTLVATGTLDPAGKDVFGVGLNPLDFEWEPGTEAKYSMAMQAFYYNEGTDAWVYVGSFPLVFKVVP